jgi:hypothetical protein
MTLLNVEASRPSPMWALVRFLAATGRPVSADRAQALLSPPCLGTDGKTFGQAVGTLEMLGMLTRTSEGMLLLDKATSSIGPDDLASYTALLRDRVFAPGLNDGLGETSGHSGARDLIRALSWFASLDPASVALNWGEAEQLQLGALKPETGPALTNRERWPAFNDWATALGLAESALLDNDRLTPDCTVAVRQTVQATWKTGDNVSAVVALHTLRAVLPVLPGGAYSQAVGVASPGDNVAGPALSFALLRCADESYIELQMLPDARQVISIYDPGQPTFPRSCSSILLCGGHP